MNERLSETELKALDWRVENHMLTGWTELGKLLASHRALQRDRDQLEDLAYRLVPNSDGPMFKTTWKAEAHKLEQERDELKQETMRWTEEKPTKPGWYWWRDLPNNRPQCIVQVKPSANDMFVFFWYDWNYATCMGGEWAGPIPEPEAREHDCN